MRQFSIIFIFLCMLIIAGCGNNLEDESISSQVANPIVEKDSLQEVNDEIGVNIISPPVMGKSDEMFFVINNEIAQYSFSVNGNNFVIRGSKITNEDISGMYYDDNIFEENVFKTVISEEYYLARYFYDDCQYTITINELNDLDEETFKDIVNEIMLCSINLELEGNYIDKVSQSATAKIDYLDGTYYIEISWSLSQNEMTTWYMEAYYENDALSYGGETITIVAIDEDGNETISDTATDNLGWFEINNGKLLWVGAAYEECRSCVFEKID